MSGQVHELEYEKSLTRAATKLVDIPLNVYDKIQSNLRLGWKQLQNALCLTDNRLWTKNFLRDMPDGFFTLFEVQAFQQAHPGTSWKQIKEACMLRFKTTDAPHKIC